MNDFNRRGVTQSMHPPTPFPYPPLILRLFRYRFPSLTSDVLYNSQASRKHRTQPVPTHTRNDSSNKKWEKQTFYMLDIDQFKNFHKQFENLHTRRKHIFLTIPDLRIVSRKITVDIPFFIKIVFLISFF